MSNYLHEKTRPSSAQRTVIVVDWNVTRKSPVGMGLVDLLAGLHAKYRFVVLAADFENPEPGDIEHVHVPVPRAPSFVVELVWPLLVSRAFRQARVRQLSPFVVRATQGQLPGAEVCDAHFCHRAYLKEHLGRSGTRGLRRVSRYLVHRNGSRLEKKAFRRARVVTVPSQGLLREIERYYPYARQKLIHIPNPLDVQSFARDKQFDREAARVELGFAETDVVFVLIALGDFARKGLEVAMGALDRLGSDRARILVVGGTASEISLYRGIAATMGLSESIQFVGFQADVRPFLWLSDAFLFPTLYEAAPKVVDQAAAAGLPLIATSAHGVEDIVVDGVNGWLVERTPESIAAAMRAAIEARAELPTMGRRACESVQPHETRYFVERWDRLLATLVAGGTSLQAVDSDAKRDPGAELVRDDQESRLGPGSDTDGELGRSP